jgi:hypothetical protein
MSSPMRMSTLGHGVKDSMQHHADVVIRSTTAEWLAQLDDTAASF